MAASLNILIVEDNDELREATLEALQAEGHRVTGVDCAEMIPEVAAWETLDLIIVDLNLPGEDGLALSRRIRAANLKIGIIMVTARGLPHDKKEGYDSGADIYMAKPVSLEELSSAIQSLARRLAPTDAVDQGLTLHVMNHALRGITGKPIGLTSAETALLKAFSLAANQRLENWQIIEILQSDHTNNPKAALELVIVRLRKKIREAGFLEPSIKSIRNWGYQLCLPLQVQ